MQKHKTNKIKQTVNNIKSVGHKFEAQDKITSFCSGESEYLP